MIIERATREDAEEILQLQRIAYQSEAERHQDWSIPPLTESLEDTLAAFDRQLFLKAFFDKDSPRIIGSVRAHLQDDTCLITRLIVHPDFQGKGTGTAMMREAERLFPQARRFELFTGHKSTRNLALYRKLGYSPFKEQRISDNLTFIFLEKTVA
jgi:ribosomal protein S18 acetylase RimI-like enzyme